MTPLLLKASDYWAASQIEIKKPPVDKWIEPSRYKNLCYNLNKKDISMKLIFENWRRYLTEDASYFGDSFVQFKERVEAGEHPLKVARETLEYIGKGSTRIVFGFPDNSTQLLKVINVELVGDEEPCTQQTLEIP